MKTINYLVAGMIGAGSLGIFGNVSGQKIEDDTIYNKNKELTELEKFNLENKQIYDDAKAFLQSQGGAISTYLVFASLDKEDLFLRTGRGFYDSKFDGLSNQNDSYQKQYPFWYVRFENFDKFPMKKKIKYAKKYKRELVRMMHNAKFKKY